MFDLTRRRGLVMGIIGMCALVSGSVRILMNFILPVRSGLVCSGSLARRGMRQRRSGKCVAYVNLGLLTVRLIRLMRMFKRVIMIFSMMVFGLRIARLLAALFVALVRRSKLGGLAARVLHDLALDAFTIAAAA